MDRTLSLAIKDDVEDLTGMFQRHGAGKWTDSLSRRELMLELDQQRQTISRWLAAPDPFTNHVANRKKRQPNTGTWLLTSKPYEHWLHGQKSFLWLYGIRK